MKRLRLIFRAVFSAFLGRKEEKYQSEIIDLSYEQMQDGLIEVKEALAEVATSKHSIMQTVGNAEREVTQLEQGAARFLGAGDEAHAREALARKAMVAQQLTDLQGQLQSVGGRQLALEENQRELETRISKFKTDKEVLKARYKAAKATAQIGEIVTGISKDAREATRAVGRITEATEQMEARGSALSELIQSGSLEDVFNPGQSPLERRALEMARDEAVEADLARLRGQLGQGEPEPALPATQP